MTTPTWKFEWNDGMSVGIPEIDAEHKNFVRLINDLNLSIAEGKEQAEIRNRLQRIVDDAIDHFEHEEQLFQSWNYPDAEGHALAHTGVMQALLKIQEAFIPHGNDAEWVDAGLLIKSLLVNHILTEDSKYANFLKSRTEKPD